MRRSAKSEYYESQRLFIPEHVPLTQHVGQVMVLGTYPDQRKIEVTFVNYKTREVRYKILPKN